MMNTKKILCCLFGLILIIPVITSASVRGKLVGKVTDKSGKGLEGVTITLKNPAVETETFTVKTKEDGRYAITGLEPILFIITIEKEGYVPRENQVKIRAGIKIEQDFEMLTPQEVRALTPITPEEQATMDFNQAVDLYGQKKFDEAIPLLNKALENNKELYQAHMVMADISLQKNDEAGANKALDAALAIKPDLTDAYLMKGNIANKAGNKDEAIKNWSTYVESNPNPTIYYNIAALHTQKQDFDKAIEAYKKAIELKPDYAEVYQTLGNIYVQKKDYKNAKLNYTKFLELKPDAPEAKEIKELMAVFP